VNANSAVNSAARLGSARKIPISAARLDIRGSAENCGP